MKSPKIIKASFPVAPKPALPPIPDLIVSFASDTTVFTLRVPSYEMGNIAKTICSVLKERGVKFTLEEKPR